MPGGYLTFALADTGRVLAGLAELTPEFPDELVASHDERSERVLAAFGEERLERLRALKRRYDPDNLLRFNLNIAPG